MTQSLKQFAPVTEVHEAVLPANLTGTAERAALDEAFAELERDPGPGEPWRKVISQIRASRR